MFKRHVKEENRNTADDYLHEAKREETVTYLSNINPDEVAVVFDKYSWKKGIGARTMLQTMLIEPRGLRRSSSVEMHNTSSRIIQSATKIVLKQHTYIIDAIRSKTCNNAWNTVFCSAGKELNAAVKKLGIETILWWLHASFSLFFTGIVIIQLW